MADMEKILELNLKKVDKKLDAKGVKFTITKEAKKHLIEKGFDPNYGARPLLRTIQRLLEDPLAEFLLTKQVTKGGTVKVDYKGPGDGLELSIA